MSVSYTNPAKALKNEAAAEARTDRVEKVLPFGIASPPPAALNREMNLRRVLRALITLEIVFLAVSVLVSYYTESSPPYVLNVYGAAHPLLAEGHLAPLGILAVALCLGLVVSWIGLWRHWNPARYLYLGAQAGMVGVDASLGTPVDSVSTTSLAMYILLTLIIGAIFALIFLSELRREFERKALP